jgi:hypothetical protein
MWSGMELWNVLPRHFVLQPREIVHHYLDNSMTLNDSDQLTPPGEQKKKRMGHFPLLGLSFGGNC